MAPAGVVGPRRGQAATTETRDARERKADPLMNFMIELLELALDEYSGDKLSQFKYLPLMLIFTPDPLEIKLIHQHCGMKPLKISISSLRSFLHHALLLKFDSRKQ